MPERDVRTIRDAKSDAPTILDNTLTSEQKQAITHDKGPLLVIAGPGSGKTEVMIRRAAYLIREKHVDPQNILLVTFTNKAADQLKDRLYSWQMTSCNNLQLDFEVGR